MENRTFLMLAETYQPGKTHLPQMMMSAKLDGIRAFWDGGITRGMLTSEVPWANTAKDGRYKNPQYATGLWTRLGKAIQAPDYWLDQLPDFLLDGELFIGHQMWEETSSIVRTLEGREASWERITYMVFDAPHETHVFRAGRIYQTHHSHIFTGREAAFASLKGVKSLRPGLTPFDSRYKALQKELTQTENVELLEHQQLHWSTRDAHKQLDAFFQKTLESGGEGVMLRNPKSLWVPKRTKDLLKYKPENDAEGTIIGWTSGEKTDLGSKLLGKMGALTLQYGDKQFKLSGFTHKERELTGEAAHWAENNPGQQAPSHLWGPISFTKGEQVTFTYTEHSQDGVPKCARYLRKRPSGV